MQRQILRTAAMLFLSGLTLFLAGPLAAGQGFDWPEEWVVFAPFERGDPLPDEADLARVPERMDRPDGTLLEPRRVHVPRGDRLDLNPHFPAPEVGNTAWIFIPLRAESERELTIGMGADWWLTAWLNGEKVLDTSATDAGNIHWPPSPADHTADATLRAGENILAVRFVSGRASALFAAGGPAEIRAGEEEVGGPQDPMRFNQPTSFPDNVAFDLDRQAFATAEWPFALPEADADLSRGALAGLQRMPQRQRRVHRVPGGIPRVLDTEEPGFPDEPVRLLLSKRRYPIEDRHLDAVLWTTPPEGTELAGEVEIALKDAAGRELARERIPEVSPTGWFFSMGLPDGLAGESGRLEAVWMQNGDVIARAGQDFDVLPRADVARSGRVAIQLLNTPGARGASMPFTVGVPFPQGALPAPERARLVDEDGAEIPLQTKVAARWSRYGDVKWLLCDFTADLGGGAREVHLEYGPDIRRAQRPAMRASEAEDGSPTLEAGRLRLSQEGLEFAFAGGQFRRVLPEETLRGAFVTRGDGQEFPVSPDSDWAWEEVGGEKAVLRRVGWYANPDSGERFCNFVTRLVFHRDSPLVRVFHSWIFTGDGNRDRIRDMGWRFPVAAEIEPLGFLADFSGGEWLGGDRLVQFDHSRFSLAGEEDAREGRTPGVMGATAGDSRVFFGAKDFWQNFPSELEFSEGAFTFYNWPRNNPPASHERPILPSKSYLVPFAHQGEMLDFRLPPEYAQPEYAANLAEGEPESGNAQGISRTEEMFLWLADAATEPEQAARIMQGLNDETLRAVVDPAWMAASGVFGQIHHRDPDKYPLDESIYEEVCHAPARWNERLGFYGMWLHGESPSWSLDPVSRGVTLYRALRRNHHGWPVRWIPYARSGDPAMLKHAEAATRQQVDVSLCHYVSEDVVESLQRFSGSPRVQGALHGVSPVAWTGGTHPRGICHDFDYFWDHYYLTGFTRARDAALLLGESAKLGWAVTQPGRSSTSDLQRFLHMYQATFDPWFLVAAHDVAETHRLAWSPDGPVDPFSGTGTAGHFWRAADRDFYAFTGDPRQRDVALNVSASYSSPWNYLLGGLWPRLDIPMIEEAATAWQLTGDRYYLARAAAYVDFANMHVYDAAEPEYFRGVNTKSGQGVALGSFTGWYIQQFPLALGAFEAAGTRPEPVPTPFMQYQARFDETVEVEGETLYQMRFPEALVRKRDEEAMPFLLDTWRTYEGVGYTWRASTLDGEPVAEGSWDLTHQVAEIPKGTPPGVYRLTVEGLNPDPRVWPGTQGAPLVPMARPEAPEVMAFERGEEGTSIGGARGEVQYWFMVPEGTREFWIRTGSVRHGYKRLTVWDPDGGRAWDYTPPEEFGLEWVQHLAEVTVPPGQDGRLWRVSGSGGLTFDPQIPPYFSVSRSKWFDPELEP